MSNNQELYFVWQRNLGEVLAARDQYIAAERIYEADLYEEINFIVLAYMALNDEVLAHLARVLEVEKHPNARGFWYLYNREKQTVDTFLQQRGETTCSLNDLTEKIKAIRDRSLSHIDKHVIHDRKQFYIDVGLQNGDIFKGISFLHDILQHTGSVQGWKHSFMMDNYDGSDVTKIIDHSKKEGLISS